MTPRALRTLAGLALAAVLLGIALLCHGCSSEHPYPPDETCRHSERIWHHESTCAPEAINTLACPVLDCLADSAIAQARDRDAVLSVLAATTVDIYGVPVRCGGVAAHGCEEGDELRLESPAAGADEQGHRLWALLADFDGGAPSGEYRCAYTDAGGSGRCYLQSFADWVSPCRGAHYP